MADSRAGADSALNGLRGLLGLRRVLEELHRELVVGLGDPHPFPQHTAQTPGERPLGGEHLMAGRLVRLLRPVVVRLDQLLLGPEVVVGVAHRHAGLRGDGTHGGRLVPPIPEQPEGRLDDLLPCTLGHDRHCTARARVRS